MKKINEEDIEKIKARVRALPTEKQIDLLFGLLGCMSVTTGESYSPGQQAHARYFFKMIEFVLDE